MRTSQTHPLQIAEAHADPGVIGITFCPGKHQLESMTGSWARDLCLDLDAVDAWGASAVVTLVTAGELRDLKVQTIGDEVTARGMRWLHLPIDDVSTPTAQWEDEWRPVSQALHAVLDDGGRVLVHCKGGLGRAGMVAAKLLIERGTPPGEAIASVRAVRKGAVETLAQEAYLHGLSWRANAAGE